MKLKDLTKEDVGKKILFIETECDETDCIYTIDRFTPPLVRLIRQKNGLSMEPHIQMSEIAEFEFIFVG